MKRIAAGLLVLIFINLAVAACDTKKTQKQTTLSSTSTSQLTPLNPYQFDAVMNGTGRAPIPNSKSTIPSPHTPPNFF